MRHCSWVLIHSCHNVSSFVYVLIFYQPIRMSLCVVSVDGIAAVTYVCRVGNEPALRVGGG